MIQGRRCLHQSWSIALLPAAALLAAACGGGSSTSSETPSSGGGGTTLQVTAQDFFFNPKSLSASSGSQVTLTFTNSGHARHSFTAPDVSVDTEAGPGETRTVMFTIPSSATVSFHCKFHASMTGTITGGGAPAQGGGSTTQTGSTTSRPPGYGGY